MRIVHEGWFVQAERLVQVDVVKRHDRLRGRLRGRPWWRGLNKRWRRL